MLFVIFFFLKSYCILYEINCAIKIPYLSICQWE